MKSSKTPEIVHPIVRLMAEDVKAGKMDRREFIVTASAFGASTAAAYGLLGAAVPGRAEAAEGKKGGTLKIGMHVLDINDPRTYDWSEKGNVARQFLETAGSLGYGLQLYSDAS